MAYRPNLSIKHELHIRKMDSALNVFGVPHVVSSTGTNKPDIIAFARGGWKVAVEYETGSKTDEDTQEMLTRRVMAYQKTFVVVADEHYDRYFGRYNKDNVVVMRFCELSKIAEEFAAHNAAHQKTFKEGSA